MKSSSKLLITKTSNDRVLSAIFSDGQPLQFHFSDGAKASHRLGDIYVGRVQNIVKNINAAFIEFDKNVMGYLALTKQESPIFCNGKNDTTIHIGDLLLVQIAKEEVKTKSPSLTCNFSLTGKNIILTHGNTQIGISTKIKEDATRSSFRTFFKEYQNDSYGFIIRTNAVTAAEDILKQNLDALVQTYHEITEFGVHKAAFTKLYENPADYLCDIRDGYETDLDEIVTDDKALYDEMSKYLSIYQKEDLEKLHFYHDSSISLSNLYSISRHLERALQSRVWMKSGAYLVIEPTEALTVIDVNTGKAIHGKKNAEETFQKINLEAAEEIAKQIRLRNLSGIIIIDFISTKSKTSRTELLGLFEQYLKTDPVKTTLVDMTALNLVEITRKKVRKPLYEQIT